MSKTGLVQRDARDREMADGISLPNFSSEAFILIL